MALTFDELVIHTGKRLNSPALAVNKHRVCQFTLDEQLTVTLEEGAPTGLVHLYAAVAKVPSEPDQGLYARLLRAQLFGAELGARLRFGLDADAGEILVQTQVLLAETGPEGFFEIFDEFVSWAVHWQEQLSEEPAFEATQNLPDDFSSFSFIRA